MAAPRVTLHVNGRRHALRRVNTMSNGFRFVHAHRRPDAAAGEPSPYVLAELHAVHTYKCRTGRWNSRKRTYDECTCGAQDLLKAFVRPVTSKRPPAKPRHGAPDWDR